jgi:hypothetical protein
MIFIIIIIINIIIIIIFIIIIFIIIVLPAVEEFKLYQNSGSCKAFLLLRIRSAAGTFASVFRLRQTKKDLLYFGSGIFLILILAFATTAGTG